MGIHGPSQAAGPHERQYSTSFLLVSPPSFSPLSACRQPRRSHRAKAQLVPPIPEQRAVVNHADGPRTAAARRAAQRRCHLSGRVDDVRLRVLPGQAQEAPADTDVLPRDAVHGVHLVVRRPARGGVAHLNRYSADGLGQCRLQVASIVRGPSEREAPAGREAAGAAPVQRDIGAVEVLGASRSCRQA